MKEVQTEKKERNFDPPTIRGVIVALIMAFICFYGLYMPFNPSSYQFWVAILLISGAWAFGDSSASIKRRTKSDNPKFPITQGPMALIAIISAVIIIIGIVTGAKIFRSGSYSKLIGDVQSVPMEEYQISLDDVPLMDSNSAYLVANRKMGTLVDLVSQFDLNKHYNYQINYQNKPVRVLPLQYAGFFKWINNRSEGIPGYVIVDMATRQAELVTVEGGMKYSPSGYFNDSISRHVYLSYPTAILSGFSFELDEEGNPVWIVRYYEKKIFPLSGSDLAGIFIVDAVTGDIEKYTIDEIPEWVDNAYSADSIIDQYDLYGKYTNGFINRFIGQRGVIATTKGYNYIAYENDIYLYTGVTSVANDESNIGFIFANLRTKDVYYFEFPSAEEYSAMESAEGLVQHLEYDATFPIMVRVAGQPTYCMALKDNGGLVKLYAMVNASQYQIVVTGTTIDETIQNYIKALDGSGISHDDVTPTVDPSVSDIGAEIITDTVDDIITTQINGTTHYYLHLTGENSEYNRFWYQVSVKDSEQIIFVKIGDEVTLRVPDIAYLAGTDTPVIISGVTLK